MNEALFFLHLILILFFAWAALKFGKEALTSWVALQAVLANLFVLKQTTLFGLEVTCSDVYAIGSILGLNLLQEFFGKESAKRATWICFALMVFFALMSQIHLYYKPGPQDHTQFAFVSILAATPRLLFASLATFLIVQQIDVRFYGLLKQLFPKLAMPLRNGMSLIVSQCLDTALFSCLGLWGLVSSLGEIFLFSFLIKLAVIFAMLPFFSFLKRRAYE
jgi:uncharacterized integral membrane protein (TIGR00697 family)